MANKIFDTTEFAKVARQAVAEGVVLLKNEAKVLPLKEGTKVAIFGRSQFNYYKSGTGSGGMVNTRYVTGVYEAIEEDGSFDINSKLRSTYENWVEDNPFDAGAGWAAEPWFQKEMPVTKELAYGAREDSEVAIVLIGRTAGEDQDNSAHKGSYLLTDDEEQMLENVTKAFDKTIVLLNVGNIIDMKWVDKYNPTAVAYIWQGGQEGGSGVIDVLKGMVSPSGKLTDTIAYDIADYPSTKNFGSSKRNIQQEDIYVGYRYFETFAKDKVMYPFGYGLSYTSFDIVSNGFTVADGQVNVSVTVTNIGDYKGKQIVQAYVTKPQGKLGKPAVELVGFAKTKELKPDEQETVDIVFTNYQMASYDDSGVTGYKSAYVLEEGTYIFYVGDSVRNLTRIGTYNIGKTKVVKQLSEALAPVVDFTRIKPEAGEDGYVISYEDVPKATGSWQDVRLALLKTPKAKPDTSYKLVDVLDNKCTMDEFVAQLSDEELMAIVRGEGMSSPKVTPGCGGAFGGVSQSLVEKGIPTCCCTDGPSGIRMDSGKKAFAMPNGTLLACMWNLDLTEKLYNYEGLELRKNKIDVLLGPGMNLHRNPLNGRNFEYFSEDPFVTGKNAAAQLKGMHRMGVTGTIKHFAMNTQEAYRHTVEHVASERAVREIYLKGFEIAVKEAGATAVMTTYGSINGYYTSSDYDLVTRILREEWGFEGIVMTDWWAKGGNAANGDAADMASIVRAQNDLYMVTQSAIDNTNRDNLEEALEDGSLDRRELQRNAKNICNFVLHTPTFARFIERNNECDIALANEAEDDEAEFDNIIDCRIDESGVAAIDSGLIETARNSNNTISVSFKERGDYKLTMRVRSNATSDLAQIPLSIFRDKELVKMVTLTGADRDWQDVEVMFEGCAMTFFLRMYFAQDGMEIEDIKITLAKSKEEEFRLMFARMGQ